MMFIQMENRQEQLSAFSCHVAVLTPVGLAMCAAGRTCRSRTVWSSFRPRLFFRQALHCRTLSPAAVKIPTHPELVKLSDDPITMAKITTPARLPYRSVACPSTTGPSQEMTEGPGNRTTCGARRLINPCFDRYTIVLSAMTTTCAYLFCKFRLFFPDGFGNSLEFLRVIFVHESTFVCHVRTVFCITPVLYDSYDS